MRAKEQERSGQSSWDEIRPHVDDALGALPKKQQDVVVLRYLQGMSEAEAARELRCPQGTVSVRLSRALKKLRSRLRRKGFGVGGAALVSFLEANTAEAAPVHLMASITAAGAAGSAGAIAAGGAAAAIAKGVMTMMMWAKVKTAAIAVGIAAALGAGVPVAINAVNGAEEPAPMNAERVLTPESRAHVCVHLPSAAPARHAAPIPRPEQTNTTVSSGAITPVLTASTIPAKAQPTVFSPTILYPARRSR